MTFLALIAQHPNRDFQFGPVHYGSFLLGATLLLAGRRLFWLFVAALGFITARQFIAPLVAQNDAQTALVLSLVAGLAGAALAIFVQKFAIGLAGAIAGAFYLTQLLSVGGADSQYLAVGALAGAVLGAVLLLFLFKWSLIIFSSVAGAHLIVQRLPVGQGLLGAIFLVLLLIGVSVQSRSLRPA